MTTAARSLREVQRPALATAIREAAKLAALDRARRFVAICEAYGLPAPVQEHRFHPTRMWRWDFSWSLQRLALEIDGGIWVGGKHGRGSGIAKDHTKRNAGAELGWRYLLVQPRDLCTMQTVDMVRRALLVGQPAILQPADSCSHAAALPTSPVGGPFPLAGKDGRHGA